MGKGANYKDEFEFVAPSIFRMFREQKLILVEIFFSAPFQEKSSEALTFHVLKKCYDKPKQSGSLFKTFRSLFPAFSWASPLGVPRFLNWIDVSV